MATRRIDTAAGQAALAQWRTHGEQTSPSDLRTAVRYTLGVLAERQPGHAVEVRVPPAGAVQVIEGPRHTRGTPPNVVETDPHTWLALATGQMTWPAAFAAGSIRASGLRADLSDVLPVLS